MLSSRWFGFALRLDIDLQRIIAAACPATAAQ